MAISESKIRDYLVELISNNHFKINNIKRYHKKLEKIQGEFFKKPPFLGGVNSKDLIKKVFAEKILRSLNHIEELKLIDKEFKLINNGSRGRKPSLDILAFMEYSKNLVLLEIKQGSRTERESVTELCAYSEFLNKKFFGLSKNNTIWIPISEAWSPTVKQAFIYQMFSSNEICIPLNLKINSKDGKNIDSLSLEIINLIDEIENMDESLFYSIFSWASYDVLTINFKDEIENKENLMHLVSSWCSELNISGFIYATESNAGKFFQYPWGIAIAFFNPFKAYLKQKQLNIILNKQGLNEMLKNIKEPIWSNFDIDLKTGKEYWITDDEESNIKSEEVKISISDFASYLNQEHIIIEKIKEYSFFLKIGDCEFGYSSLSQIMNDDTYHLLNAIQKFTYFGLLEKVFLERIKYDFSLKDEHGDSEVVGALPQSPFSLYSDWSYFFDFMHLMNFEHGSQEVLYETFKKVKKKAGRKQKKS